MFPYRCRCAPILKFEGAQYDLDLPHFKVEVRILVFEYSETWPTGSLFVSENETRNAEKERAGDKERNNDGDDDSDRRDAENMG